MMLAKVHGIMFLSTPHRGSSYARTLNSFLALMMGSSKVYVSELESSSTTIEDISAQFRGICGPWKLVSLYETLPTKVMSGVRKLVSIFALPFRLHRLLTQSRSSTRNQASSTTLRRSWLPWMLIITRLQNSAAPSTQITCWLQIC